MTILQVTPEYIVVISNPAEMIVNEFEMTMQLQRCKDYKSRVIATISPKGGIRLDR